MIEKNPKNKRLGRPKADAAGDLRQEILTASLDLLNEGGPSALSMREVARRTGCTHQAPYHYFADRESILAALVCEGFDNLAQQLFAANEHAATNDLRSGLLASAQAYVGFALAQPGLFRIMFRPDMCNPLRFPQVIEAAKRARQELDRLNEIVYREKATAGTATILWSHVHGLSCLLVDGPLGSQFGDNQQTQVHLSAVSQAFADLVRGPLQVEVRDPVLKPKPSD